MIIHILPPFIMNVENFFERTCHEVFAFPPLLDIEIICKVSFAMKRLLHTSLCT